MSVPQPEAQFSAHDRELLARAGAWDQCPDLRDFSSEKLVQIAQSYGLDFATAILYDRVLRHDHHGAFFQRVRSPASAAKPPALVGIVRGAFYHEHKNTGADGARVIEIVSSLNCAVECVPLESFGSLTRNATLIAEWLRKHQRETVMLISLSKGSADLKVALGLPGAAELFCNVGAWISLSGLVQGTPLVAWLRRKQLRQIGVRCLLWLRGHRYSVVEELRHESDGPLVNWPAVPSHLRIIHVVAFPLCRHLAHPWAKRAYERIAPLGPNDGGGVLLDTVAKIPGTVFPVWGADHYLQPAWDATPLLRRVVLEAMSPNAALRQANPSAAQPIRPPANRSTA